MNRTTTPGTRTPAPFDLVCPHCEHENIPPRKIVIWLVTDERGRHYECDVCSHGFFHPLRRF